VRRRRWKLVSFGVAVAVGAVATVAVVRLSEPSAGGGNTAACVGFERLRSDLARGGTTPSTAATALKKLQVLSAGADTRIQQAISDMRGAADPATTSFQVARTELVDACTAAKQ
jgi:hypothetical protein